MFLKELRIIGLSLLCLFLSCQLLLGQGNVTKALVLKDGSIIKGEIIEQTEFLVRIKTLSGDVSEYSFKYIDKIIEIGDEEETYLENLSDPRHHKTGGTFYNLNIYSIPIGLDIGRRVNSRLDLGGQLGFLISQSRGTGFNFGDILGVGPMARYYLSENQYKAKGFVKGMVGVALALNNREGNNSIKPYAGLSIGWQIPSRKKTRFYFDLGFYAIYEKSTQIIRSPTVAVINSTNWDVLPQFTIIGLQF